MGDDEGRVDYEGSESRGGTSTYRGGDGSSGGVEKAAGSAPCDGERRTAESTPPC